MVDFPTLVVHPMAELQPAERNFQLVVVPVVHCKLVEVLSSDIVMAKAVVYDDLHFAIDRNAKQLLVDCAKNNCIYK